VDHRHPSPASTPTSDTLNFELEVGGPLVCINEDHLLPTNHATDAKKMRGWDTGILDVVQWGAAEGQLRQADTQGPDVSNGGVLLAPDALRLRKGSRGLLAVKCGCGTKTLRGAETLMSCIGNESTAKC